MPSSTFFNLPDQKRESLIEIAVDEFSNHDYDSASISRIVHRAGIAKGSFYQYFQDKKDLYLYLVGLISTTKTSFLQEIHPTESKMKFFDYLLWLFEASIRFDLTHPALSKLRYRIFYGDLPFRDKTMEEAKEASSNFFRNLVIEGMDQGDIDPGLDSELVVFVIDILTKNFGDYVPKKLGLKPEEIAQEGITILDIEATKKIFKDLVDVLQFGLIDCKAKAVQLEE
ncbi:MULTISPECIES: TetR/AcrR family transcriptional regulator [Cyanophyceae]|uniref:TetR/AcrR family transcriptional regulator n=1 Tax=Cyanophyceae TaxID=3028117 RepID=UPI0016835686|nr:MULTISPECIES: TetR/AcrR family transcriptional regulator [Cyanophyceae]MBD1914384.1 TetR/AcrR family transcriptional regulator [Phormidium sp. FACHB-77]MBD2028633.1 TetR/AcrR family transcriptional regulator [Phormidium sp. FACHB-322]MBD2053673.1 TetR/AcrR family transcriptional regulator [Leptolyngbya sp. FACHB-60]